MNNKIAMVVDENANYPDKKDLFRPHIDYPEYPFHGEISSTENKVYDMVRQGFALMKMDIEHYNLPDWNPLGDIIQPGNTVLIKPNLVMDHNACGSELCMYTQPSVVAAIVDYVIVAFKNNFEGRIIVGDAPVQECDFNKLINNSGYKDVVDWYKQKGICIELVDFRAVISEKKNHIIYSHEKNDELGVVIDLKKDSQFAQLPINIQKKLRISNYDPSLLNTHHTEDKHEYFVTKYLLESDVIINVPKPKTHCKAGMTAALKNIVGINVRKEYLPHHIQGSKKNGGDEYLKPSKLKAIASVLQDHCNKCTHEKRYTRAWVIHYVQAVLKRLGAMLNQDWTENGNWSGNNTISKTIVDLNKILFYADKNGHITDTVQRKNLIVADMIIAGEGNGPLSPKDKHVGTVIVGYKPVQFDKLIATIMGAKLNRIPVLSCINSLQNCMLWQNENCIILSNKETYNEKNIEQIENKNLHFNPPNGWKDAFNFKV